MSIETALENRYSQASRASLAKTIINLFDRWQLLEKDRLALLGMSHGSRTTLNRYREGQALANNDDLLERVGHLLSIHKSLRILFPHDRAAAYAWMTAPNTAFNNLSAVQVIKDYKLAGLINVRAKLDRQRSK